MIRFIDCIVDQHDDIGDIIIREADFQAGFHFLDRCQRNTVQAGKTMLDILTEIVPFGYGEGLLRLLFWIKRLTSWTSPSLITKRLLATIALRCSRNSLVIASSIPY